MTDSMGTPGTAENPALVRLLELKNRLSDLKLEALRRGYGLEPANASVKFEDLDSVVAEVEADVEQLRASRDGVRQSQPEGDCPITSRV